MSWTPHAWPLALLALSLLPACPAADDTEDTAAESGPSNDTTVGGSASTDDAASTADETASADGSVMLGCAAGVTAGSSPDPIMLTWGAACTTNEDCIDLIGDPAAVCDFEAVVYELPGGYCTKACTLPDLDTRAVADDPNCSPEGGVTCLGVMGTFERCAIPCTDSQQCNREGYECRQLPLVSNPDTPSFCLMPDCCDLNSCDE
jgi:hypothetical protein